MRTFKLLLRTCTRL